MDRRQKKTRAAIFKAFIDLLEKESYSRITVQEIIDQADIGRTTFYAHFETKDHLLKALCDELFGHIISTAIDSTHTHGLSTDRNAPRSIFCHLLQHLEENDYNILGLLSSGSNEIFIRCFKDSLNELIESQFMVSGRNPISDIPQDFLVNHISGSFVDMVLWWVRGGLKERPEELDRYFRLVNAPILG